MRKRTVAARAAFQAAEDGFRAWRAGLQGPPREMTSHDAWADYVKSAAGRGERIMTRRAFGIRARAAFGAGPNRKRRTVYLAVGPAAGQAGGEGDPAGG